MVKQEKEKEMSKNVVINKKNYGGGGAVYGLGLIGALIYYLSHSTTFGMGVMGILKALVWPALLVYSLLSFLKL